MGAAAVAAHAARRAHPRPGGLGGGVHVDGRALAVHLGDARFGRALRCLYSRVAAGSPPARGRACSRRRRRRAAGSRKRGMRRGGSCRSSRCYNMACVCSLSNAAAFHTVIRRCMTSSRASCTTSCRHRLPASNGPARFALHGRVLRARLSTTRRVPAAAAARAHAVCFWLRNDITARRRLHELDGCGGPGSAGARGTPPPRRVPGGGARLAEHRAWAVCACKQCCLLRSRRPGRRAD